MSAGKKRKRSNVFAKVLFVRRVPRLEQVGQEQQQKSAQFVNACKREME